MTMGCVRKVVMHLLPLHHTVCRLHAAAAALGLAVGSAPLAAQDLPGQKAAADAARQAATTAGPALGKTFIMAAFPSTSEDRLSLFTSSDGVSYRTLASETYRPPQGLLRDPSLIRADDGSYLITYTTGGSGQTFGVARSRDLRRWEHVADVPVQLPGVQRVWAPEWFRDADGQVSVIVSLSTETSGKQFRAYRLQPSRPDSSAFDTPRILQGLDRNPIDTFVVREGGRYVALSKNETTQQIERAWAPALDGPWKYDRTGDWAGWGEGFGGPSLVRIRDTQGRAGWRLHLDDDTKMTSRYADSFDGLQSWTPLRPLGGVSGAVRHFTVLEDNSDALARATAPRGPRHRLTWDRHSLLLDGKRRMIWAAEFQPFRLPSPALWRDVLQKLEALGFNTVSIYFSWGYHSSEPGQYDFSGVRNVERVLQMAEEEGLFVIARPGPYVNAELSAGGFPGWLLRQRVEARTDAPEYQAAAAGWLAQINTIIARHQFSTGGGSVIAYQLENELFSVQPKNARHMQFLADQARADGITVPLFHNAASRLPDWTPKASSAPFANPGPTDLYAFDGYPGGVCGVDAEPGAPSAAPDWGIYGTTLPRIGAKASPGTPGFVAEMGAGWFDYRGSNGTYECTARRQGAGYQRVFYGSNLINGISLHSIYMGFGGTTWGWQPAPVVYTSYDYGAPIDEARRLRGKGLSLKLMSRFVQAAEPVLADMEPAAPLVADNPKVKLYHNQGRALGSHVVFAVQQPSSATETQHFTFELATRDGRYRVPQQGQLMLRGQDAKLLLGDYTLERQHLVYATSELFTHLRRGSEDLAVLHGRRGEDGEAVLGYARRPRVRVLTGQATNHWDAGRGDLRLNYRHEGLIELLVEDGGRAPLRLLVADEATAQALWRLDAAGDGGPQPLLVQSPALARSAQRQGDVLILQGDTAADSPLSVWAPPGIRRLNWNGQEQPVDASADGSLRARQALPGPAAVRLPDLLTLPWLRRADSPEADPAFDDSRWRAADAGASAANVYTANDKGQPVLAMSDYGFHRGDVWYRGRFRSGAGTPAAKGPLQLELFYGGGGAGMAQVWLDGRFIGQHELDTGRPFPETTDSFELRLDALAAGEHVLAVMVRNNGHNWDLFADDAHKEARGLIAASLAPRAGRRFAVPVAWKIQGNEGGEAIADLVRGPYNSGGLYGERQGWHLPTAWGQAPGAGWSPASPGDAPPAPGTYWLRTQFELDAPADHDVQLGLGFGDTSQPRSAPEQRVLIFVNGWNLGQFISHIGPQRVYVLPPGVLNLQGANTLALAITTDGRAHNALETPRLLPLRVVRGGVPLEPVPAPRTLLRRSAP